MMKRLYCLFTAILIALNLNILSYGSTDSSLEGFIYALTAAEENYITEIDCSAYNVDCYKASYALTLVEMNNPYLYSVNKIQYTEKQGKLKTVTLVYDYTEQIYASQRTEINAVIEEIIAETKGMTNPEKIQTVYNNFVNNVAYDTTLSTADYNVYTLFTEGRGKCKSFAGAFKLVMDKLDIPCKVVSNLTSPEQDMSNKYHAWNEVYVNENWVKIDITYDRKT